MSISQIESKIRSLQTEIERLGSSLTDETKREANYRSSVRRTENSVTKNTSPSSLKAKQRSISSDNDRIDKSKKKQAEIQEKISKKRTELVKQQELLQKEQNKAFKAIVAEQDEAIAAQRKVVSGLKISTNNVSMIEKECDFFISHASEDKSTVAEPLAKALLSRGAKVWLDKYAMTVGDSLRQSIDDGLAHSRYGIVILSEIYFNKFWTGKELNGLFAKQEDGEKVILPIWHNISKDTVKQYSPVLADMLALKTADFTIDEIADQFMKLIH